MKRLVSLVLTISLMASLLPFAVSAVSYDILGDSVISRPPAGTTAAMKYSLSDGGNAVEEGVSWSVTETEGLTMEQDGILRVTSPANQHAEEEIVITVTAMVGGAVAATKDVTVNKELLYHDFEDKQVGAAFDELADLGFRTSKTTSEAVLQETDGNRYASSSTGGGSMNAANRSDPAIVGFSGGRYSKIREAKTVTLEAKLRNNSTGGWGVSNRKWAFYYCGLNSGGTGTAGGAFTSPSRFIDIRTDEETGGYVFGTFNGKTDTGVMSNSSPQKPAEASGVISDDTKVIKSPPLAWGAVEDISTTEGRGWIAARMTLDFNTHTYSFWADDVLIFEDYALPSAIKGRGIGYWYIGCDADDVAVYTGEKYIGSDAPAEGETPSGWEMVFEETYDSAALPDGWSGNALESGALSHKVSGGVYEIRHTASAASDTALNLYKQFAFIQERDEQNHTRLISEQIGGAFAMDLEFDANITSQGKAETPAYALLSFGAGAPDTGIGTLENTLLQLRLQPVGAMNIAMPQGQKQESIGELTGVTGLKNGQKNLLRIVADGSSFDLYLNDMETPVKEGMELLSDANELFGALRLQLRSAVEMDSYIKLYGLRVYQVTESSDGAFSEARQIAGTLPPGLTEDPMNVTEDIDMSGFEGEEVRICSDNEEALTPEGKITRLEFDDANISLSAEFECVSSLSNAVLRFKKVYDFVIKSTNETREVIAVETPGSFDENMWAFGGDEAVYIFDREGLTLTAAEAGKGADGVRLYKLAADGTRTDYEQLFDAAFTGVYEFEITGRANISSENPAFWEIGCLDAAAGEFTPYLRVGIANGRGYYEVDGVQQDIPGFEDNAEQKIKIRIHTEDKTVSLWNGTNLPIAESVAYTADGGAPINALRVGLDTNGSAGDAIVLQSAKLVRRINQPSKIMETLRAAAQTIRIADITDTPENVENGSLKQLPSEAGGYPIVWGTDQPEALDLSSGKVYKGTETQNVIISATVTDGGFTVVKEFYVTVKPAKDAAEQLGIVKNQLTWEKISGQPEKRLKYDLTLPNTGAFAAEINWFSSKPDVLSADGKINKSAVIREDTPVTLRAEIVIGSARTKKDFAVVVAKRGAENEVIADGAPGSDSLYCFEVDGRRFAIHDDVTISLSLQASASDGEAALVDEEGGKLVSVVFSGGRALVNGTYAVPVNVNAPVSLTMTALCGDERAAVWLNGALAADYVPVQADHGIFSIQASGSVRLSQVHVYMDDYSVFALNNQVFGYLCSIPRAADGDLELCTDTIFGAQAEWSTSDPDVITSQGVIKKSVGTGFAELTLTLKNAHTEQRFAPVTVLVPCDGTAAAKPSASATSAVASSDFPLTNAFDGDFDTYFRASLRNGRENSVTLTLSGETHVNQLLIYEATPVLRKYKVEYSDDGRNWAQAAVGAMRDLRSCLVSFEPVKSKYLKLSLLESDESYVEIAELTPMLVIGAKQKAQLELEEIHMSREAKIEDDISLPAAGIYGSVIQWHSSHPEILSSAGVYSAPQYDTDVTLTAYIETEEGDAEKMFVVTAAGSDGAKGAAVVSGGGGGSGSGSGKLFGGIVPAPSEKNEENEKQSGQSNLFGDLRLEHWAYSSVETLVTAGIVSGDSDGNFYPDRTVTREEFAKMLLCAASGEINTGLENSFIDVGADTWYKDYILSAQKAGIINGISDNVFGVGSGITRQDAAVMLVRAARDITEPSGVRFADDEEIAEYAAEAVYTARKLGLMNGYADHSFQPLNRMTRAEAAAVICRFMTNRG